MKIVTLVLATAIAAVIGSAPTLAQSPNNDAGRASPSDPAMTAPMHPNPNQWARDTDRYRPSGWRHGGNVGWRCPWMRGAHAGWMRGAHAGWMTGGPGWMGRQEWRRFHRRPRGAHFIFRRGNARIDIQCPADQNVKACAEAAGIIIDKVRSLRPQPALPPQATPKPPAGPNGSGAAPDGATPKTHPNRT